MNQNNTRQVDQRQWYPAALLFLLLNVLIIYSQGFILTAALICPIYLLFIYSRHGTVAFFSTAAAGLLPYAVLGGADNLLAAAVTFLIMTFGHLLVIKLKASPAKALLIMAAAGTASMVFNLGILIYIVEKTDFMGFFAGIASESSKMVLNVLEQSEVTLPESQKLLFKEIAAALTPTMIADQVAPMVIQYGAIIGYLGLRLSWRAIADGRLKPVKVPYFSELKINTLVLFPTFVLILAGVYFEGSSLRAGSLLYNTGYSLLTFLGVIGGLSMVWWFLSARMRVTNRLARVLGAAAAMFLLGTDTMILMTVVDSVMDFRNLSGSSLWAYLIWKFKATREE